MTTEEFVEKWAIKFLDGEGNDLIISYRLDMTEDLNQFKKEALLEFLYWWMPEIHPQDAHSQINKFERQLTKQK